MLGLGYALALASATVLLARGEWRRRVAHLLAAAAAAAIPAGVFYLQAWQAGAGPFAAACEGMNVVRAGSRFPGPFSVVVLWRELLHDGNLLTAFLGTSKPKSLELGLGPQALLLLAALLLPVLLRRSDWRPSESAVARILRQLG